MKTRIVVLGAGFGGLELTTMLSEAVSPDIDLVLIDQSDTFVFGFSKLDVMFGRQLAAKARHAYRDFVKPGVRFIQTSVRSIDPAAKRVVTRRPTRASVAGGSNCASAANAPATASPKDAACCSSAMKAAGPAARR